MKFPEKLNKIGPTETVRRELRALDRESDPELRLSGLLSLGRRLLGRNETPAALRIFQIVKSESAETFPELAGQAEREIAAIEGRGAFGQRAEFLSRQFFREASSPAGLIAMAGSQAVFGLTRAALLSRLASRSFGARALASTGAFALEAPSFVAFTRAARAAGGEKQDWSRQALGEETAASFLTLGALKLGAWAGGSRPGLTTASTLGGILLGHRLEEWAGLRPPADGAMALTEGLTTLLHFKVAGRLLGSALGPRWAAFQQELHWRGEGRSGPGWELAPAWRSLAPAGGPAAFPAPPILRMQGLGSPETILRGKLLQEAPKPVQKRIEEIKAGLEFSEQAVLWQLVQEMAGRGRQALSDAEKKFLLTLAHRQLDEYSKPPHEYYQAYQIFTLLQDFPGLRRLADVVEEGNAHRRLALWMLEDYNRAFGSSDRDADFFQGLHRAVFQQVGEFAAKHGYPKPNTFMLDRTAANLKQLAASYDLVLAIAKGGLSSGGVAEFLDIPVKVVDIHAHNRKKPTSKFVGEVRTEEIAGKRILFVDKDIVSGASIEEALRLISPYRPAAVGAYFNHEPARIVSQSTLQELRNRGIALHFPNEIEAPSSTLAIFHHAHEKLNTPLGRLRRASRELQELLGEEARPYLEREERAFFALNPLVPGVLRIRASMMMRLEGVVQSYRDALKFDPGHAQNYAFDILRSNPVFPVGSVDELARARYYGKGIEAAEDYGLANVHGPHSYVAAFNAAQKTVKRGHELALIVGPEGFAYAPIFHDLGLETLAVNIGEANPAGKRPVEALDDLSRLRGKKVLVVEDDVHSGEPLRSLLAEIKPYRPSALNLYLGLPAFRQNLENVPPGFRKVYITEEYRKEDEAAFLKHLKKRESLFKDEGPGLDL
ncbi:MAG TPA: phosphoribosyltransferase family protein [bacterium]|nr:phosphoribosyltransferase family protein [bacterium]